MNASRGGLGHRFVAMSKVSFLKSPVESTD